MTTFILPNYTIYFDSNAAFSKVPDNPISSKLLKALEETRRLTGLVAKVPFVVVEELCYQKTQAAFQSAENQRKNSETIQSICGINPPPIPDYASLKNGTRERFNECLKTNSIEVIETPVGKIDWLKVIEDACWRIPPFEKPKSEDNFSEKGFRDCLIIESILHDLQRIEEGHIAVISGDKVFSRALQIRVGALNGEVEIYESISAFTSHIQLLSATKSDQFATAVLAKVTKAFYDPENPDCVVFAHNLLGKLKDEYEEVLRAPSFLSLMRAGQSSDLISRMTLPAAKVQSYTGDWMREIEAWSPVSDLKFEVCETQFTEPTDDGRYHWKSRVTIARLLRRTRPVTPYQTTVPDERIRLQRVDVDWSAEIKIESAEFLNAKIEKVSPVWGDDFVEADLQMRSRFGLPLIPGFDPE